MPFFEDIDVEYEDGETAEVELHDGSHIILKKIERDFGPTNRRAACSRTLTKNSSFSPGSSVSTPQSRTSSSS